MSHRLINEPNDLSFENINANKDWNSAKDSSLDAQRNFKNFLRMYTKKYKTAYPTTNMCADIMKVEYFYSITDLNIRYVCVRLCWNDMCTFSINKLLNVSMHARERSNLLNRSSTSKIPQLFAKFAKIDDNSSQNCFLIELGTAKFAKKSAT